MYVVTAENMDEMKEKLPFLDMRAELRPGCFFWDVYEGGQRGWIAVWPDTGRAAVCWGGNAAWGNWDGDNRVIVLDESAADGETIVVNEKGEEIIVDPYS